MEEKMKEKMERNGREEKKIKGKEIEEKKE